MSKTVTLNRFDGGIINDPRSRLEGVSRIATNFDALTDQYRLVPYRDSEDGHSAQSTNKIQNFVIALGPSSTYRLFGLGVTSGSGVAEIYYKNLTTGSTNDLDDNGWTETANNADGGGAMNPNLFVYYAKRGRIFFSTTNNIGSYDPTGSASIDDEERAITYTNIAQGLVHSKDDILYIPYDNKIATNNNNSWNNTALTLPSHLYITSICEFGNYLAIGCAPLSSVGESVVFLWDRDSTLVEVSQRISWGTDVLKILDVVDGELIGISLSGGVSSRIEDRVVFRKYIGADQQQKFLEFVSETASVQLPIAKRVYNNRLYFNMVIELNGETREGVWSIGRASPQQEFAVIHERTPNDDTALTSGVLRNFIYVGDYLFQSFVNNSVETMTKTNDSASYSATSIMETVINPGVKPEDFFKEKQLVRIAASYEALPTAGQLVLEVRVDGGSWQEVMSRTTDDEIAFGTGVLSDGITSLPKGREIEFRIESTGGAVPTGIQYVYDVDEDHIGG